MVSGWGILNFTGRVKSGAFCPSVKAIAASFLEEFLLPEALSIKTGVLYCKRNPQDKNGQGDREVRQRQRGVGRALSLNRASRDWHTRIVTLNGVKGLAVRFFAALRMTVLRNSRVKCTNVLNSGLALVGVLVWLGAC